MKYIALSHKLQLHFHTNYNCIFTQITITIALSHKLHYIALSHKQDQKTGPEGVLGASATAAAKQSLTIGVPHPQSNL